MNDIEYLQSVVDNNYESGEALRRIAKILKGVLEDKERRKQFELEMLTYDNIRNRYKDFE